MLSYFEDVELVHSQLVYRHKFHPHWRDYGHCSFILVTEGALYYQKDEGVRYELQAPFVAWHHPNCSYRYGPIEGEPYWSHYYAAFTGERALRLMEEGFMNLGDLPFAAHLDLAYCIQLFEQVPVVVERHPDHAGPAAIQFMEQLLLHLDISQDVSKPMSPAHECILELVASIQRSPTNDVDFKQWAMEHGMSYVSFRVQFKKLLKTSPQQYLLRRRLVWAKNQVVNTARPIKEIGYELGYADPEVFSRMFRKRFGITAQEVRKASLSGR